MNTSIDKFPSPCLDELYGRYPALTVCKDSIAAACGLLLDCFRSGGKVLVCGNGGSAADAEHIVGELLKSFRKKRSLPEDVAERLGPDLASSLEGSLPAVSLVSMSAMMSAFANDVCWENVFAQETLALAMPCDVLIVLSTSGNSKDCVAAAKVMKAVGGRSLALTGSARSQLSDICDVTVMVPETETFKVQELHLPVYHAICAWLEDSLF